MTVDRRTKARVQRAYADMPDEFLLCRDPAIKHRMNTVNDLHPHTWGGDPRFLIARDMECERCGTTRKDVFEVEKDTVTKIRSSYHWPAGYLIHGVVQGIKPSVLVYTEMYQRVQDREKARKRKASAARAKRRKAA